MVTLHIFPSPFFLATWLFFSTAGHLFDSHVASLETYGSLKYNFKAVRAKKKYILQLQVSCYLLSFEEVMCAISLSQSVNMLNLHVFCCHHHLTCGPSVLEVVNLQQMWPVLQLLWLLFNGPDPFLCPIIRIFPRRFELMIIRLGLSSSVPFMTIYLSRWSV